jgi:hypothetical protein
MESENLHHHEHNHGNKLTKKIRENPWILSTIVLSFLVLIIVIGSFAGSFTGKTISEKDVTEKVVNYFQAYENIGVNVTSINKTSGIYFTSIVTQDGRTGAVSLTADGKYIGMLSLLPESVSSSNTETKEIPKSDKPSVQLYVWGYCPYGVAAQEKLVNLVSLLKNKIDMKVILYYDGHGEFETQQNKMQACIQKVDNGKYWDYINGFVGTIYPKCGSTKTTECDKTESVKLMKSLGIDSTKVMECVSTDGEKLINEYSKLASEKSVSGSPTLIINGVQSDSIYSGVDAIQNAICSAFENVPSECSTKLNSTTSATASGSCA